jgi:hypothetical protein
MCRSPIGERLRLRRRQEREHSNVAFLATDSFGTGLLVLGVIAVSGAAAALFIVPPDAGLADGADDTRADVGRAAWATSRYRSVLDDQWMALITQPSPLRCRTTSSADWLFTSRSR